MLCKLTNLFWFTQNFPGFSTKSTISWENPQSLASQDGWSPYHCKKDVVWRGRQKTHSYKCRSAKCQLCLFVAMLPVPTHSGEKKKKRLKTTLDSPSALSFDSSKTELGKEFSSFCMIGMSVQDWLWKPWPATLIAQQPPALSFSRTGNVIFFLSLLSARLKTYQDDLWFRLSRARLCPQAKYPRALAKLKIHLTNWALTRWGRS